MRALMHPDTLNELLSAYASSQGSRNCMVICHKVETQAPGRNHDRARLFHSEEVACSFRLMHGQWWWADAAL